MTARPSIDQFWLPGLNPPGGYNFFFAILPKREAVDRAKGIVRDYQHQYRLSKRSVERRLHVSLCDLGSELDAARQEKAFAAAASLAAAPFSIVFDEIISFKNARDRKPLVLQSTEDLPLLAAFQRDLGSALAGQRMGLKPKKNFTPHMTLLYAPRLFDRQSIDPVHWIADEFVLVQSDVGRSTHHILGRWRLKR